MNITGDVAKRIALIDAPGDLGAGNRGASDGPGALRRVGMDEDLRRAGLRITRPKQVLGPANGDSKIVSGSRNLHAVATWCSAVRDSVARELTYGHLPVLIGGDHALSIGSIAAVSQFCRERRKRLEIVWLDAHADFNTHRTTPTGNVHGMPVAVLSGDGPRELTEISAVRPMVDISQITLVGIRSIDDGEKRRIRKRGLRTYPMRQINRLGMLNVMKEVVSRVFQTNSHLHVSFDVDFMDPSAAPGVGTREPGGPDLIQTELCLSMLADTGVLGSVDVVELNPRYDREDRTAKNVSSLLRTLLVRGAKRTVDSATF